MSEGRGGGERENLKQTPRWTDAGSISDPEIMTWAKPRVERLTNSW